VIADFYSADLGNPVTVRPAAGCLDINDNIILLPVESEVDAGNLGSDSCVIKLAVESIEVANSYFIERLHALIEQES
jgi:hypothetical protein